MITCFLRYEVKLDQLANFEVYARKWITLVEQYGGKHHGYFMPAEGASDEAYALFTFDSLAAYEVYRSESLKNPVCTELFKELPAMVHRYDRTFLRPVLQGTEV